MKTSLRSTSKCPLPKSILDDEGPSLESVHPNLYAVAAILAERQMIEDIGRGVFRGDIVGIDWRDMPSPVDDLEFMRSVMGQDYPGPDEDLLEETPKYGGFAIVG